MKEILQKDNIELRKMSVEVKSEEILSPKIKRVLEDLKESLAVHDDGIALSAPQIGKHLRIFIISKKFFDFIETGEDKENVPKTEKKISDDLVFINPEIVKLSNTKQTMKEGCLSVRWFYGDVIRSEEATIKACDEKGGSFTYKGSGLLAQIFQHEIDHLNGILFIDKAKNIEEILPNN